MNSVLLYVYLLSPISNWFIETVCFDTPLWDDTFGYNCEGYMTYGWCKTGVINIRGGSNYNFPESNCCVCGKGALDM